MTDEAAENPLSPSAAEPATETTAVAEHEHEHEHDHAHDHEHDHDHEHEEEKPEKLTQTVDIRDIGPCKKHIKVTVERADIDKRVDERFKDLVNDSVVPGFRPGKAPKSIVRRKFKSDVMERVRGEILLSSLEQLAEDFDVAPLSPPNINPDMLNIPDDGPFIYEFEVEVRPSFDLPNYKGLRLKRPTKVFADKDVEEEERRILARWGQLVPKEGAIERGDFAIVDMQTKMGDKNMADLKEISIRVDDTVAFKDAVAKNFGADIIGAKPGDVRQTVLAMTDAVADANLRGREVQATLTIKDVKRLRLPELDEQFLGTLGVKTPDQLRERVRVVLDRRLEYTQRQSARQQVTEHIAAAANWELPNDLLQRQARRAMGRRTMEMREAGMSEEEIQGRMRLLQQDVLSSTALSLKEHFVLQKIAEVEKIEVDDDDIASEIDDLAAQSDESPRRVRAQLEKEDMMDTLAAQIIERKALDLILQSAEYEDVPLDKEASVAAVEQQASPGEMHDPTAVPEKPAEDSSKEAPAAEQS